MVVVIGMTARATQGQMVNPGVWLDAGHMIRTSARHGLPLVKLADGRIIASGGGSTLGRTVESYDEATWTWSELTEMRASRAFHTGTLLRDGSLLVVGGNVEPDFPPFAPIRAWDTGIGLLGSLLEEPDAEIFHPDTNSWETVGSDLSVPRWGHVAALLPSGEVLIAGGHDETSVLKSVEIFNPNTRQWRLGPSMVQPRHFASAVSLPNGQVLVVGGTTNPSLDWTGVIGSNTVEIFDPTTGTWSLAGQMKENRWHGTATVLLDGKVLVAGITSPLDELSTRAGSSELFEPESRSWSNASSMVGKLDVGMSATRLQSGGVLLAGGNWIADWTSSSAAVAQVFDPISNEWHEAAQLNGRHAYPGTVLLQDGSVLLVGRGAQPERFWERSPTPSPTSLPTITITVFPSYTATSTTTSTDLPPVPTPSSTRTASVTPKPSLTAIPTATREKLGSWKQVASPQFPRLGGDATLLSDGRALFAGGYYRVLSPTLQVLHPPAEIYDPATDSWTLAGQLTEPRTSFKLLLLKTGEVFAVGGEWDRIPKTSVERYDVESNSWTVYGELDLPPDRSLSNLVAPAIELSNAQVLLSGTWPTSSGGCKNALSSDTFLLDMKSKTLNRGPGLGQARSQYMAARLTDGSIMITGGSFEHEEIIRFCERSVGPIHTTELLRPGDTAFRALGNLTSAHSFPVSNLVPLSQARAVIVGGTSLSSPTSIELFDSITESWTSVSGMISPRNAAQVAELSNQKLLIAGGFDSYTALATSELFDLQSKQWFDAGNMMSPRGRAASVVLRDGRVLVAGGEEQGTAEVYTVAETLKPVRLFAPSLFSRRH